LLVPRAEGRYAKVVESPREQTLEPSQIAQPWTPRGLRRAMAVLGGIYLAAVWLDASGTGIPSLVLPLPLRFFIQEAALFPHAAQNVIEWRVEGWSCQRHEFHEIDVRPYFPIRRDDKESRFYRAMFFHSRQQRVLEALDAYVTHAENQAHPEERIGGVVLLSLRIPIPPPGAREPRYQRLALAQYPREIERRHWYVTSAAERTRRCQEIP